MKDSKGGEKAMTIAERNDIARKSMGVGCMLVQTIGVNALPVEKQSKLREAVEKFDEFNENNDPWHEHDFGKIIQDRVKYFWKIDDYGENYKEHGSTHRLILTIMRADEY